MKSIIKRSCGAVLLMLAILACDVNLSFAQSEVEWSPDYVLKLEDFQSPQSEINPELNSISIFSGAIFDFNYQMTRGQFMFTKNFNDKVNNKFNRKVAVIIAPDTLVAQSLVAYGQYSFDLSELYARKFRKAIYDQKGTFSDASFFQPIYQKLYEQLNEENARVLKVTNLGQNEALLKEEHSRVLTQIDELAEFCKECKPKKNKK